MLNRNAGRSSSGMRWPLISPGKDQQRPIFNSTGRLLRRRGGHPKLQMRNWKLEIGNTGKQSLHLLMGCFFSFSLLLLPTFLDAQTSPLKNMNFPRLIETAELVPLMNHPSVRIIDMRDSLLDYLKGHIPNSVYLHFETLRVPRTGIPAQGPDRIFLEKLIRDYLSISNPMWVILYSEKSNPNPTFLAWVLDYLGHKKVGVVNGGWEKWTVEKLPVTQNYPSLSPGKFYGKVMPDTLAEKKWVMDHLSTKGPVIAHALLAKKSITMKGEEVRRG